MIIDANLLVYVLSNDPRGASVLERFTDWLERGVELDTPQLAAYEVVKPLTRLAASGVLTPEAATNAARDLFLFPIRFHPIRDPGRVLEIAFSLRRSTAYDATYLALTEELHSELWTFDGPLYKNASQLGFPVHLLV